MAGSYPNTPSRRMAYDDDGSVVLSAYASGSGPINELSASDRENLNSESENSTKIENDYRIAYYLWCVFPELRDVYGVFYAGNYGAGAVHTSPDTTNGRDGTWTEQYADLPDYDIVMGNYRTDITPISATSVRSIRVYLPGATIGSSLLAFALHVYGTIAAGSTTDRLLYISQSTGLTYTGPIDWGDIPRGTVYDEFFYIKNNSSTETATNTTLSFESLYLGSDAFYTLSTGVGWSTGYGPIATLAAGARFPTTSDSPTYLTVRCDPPSTAPFGLHAARMVMATSSWST
jgi:hypothetical protein